MDLPPQPPPTTATVRARGSETERPTWLQSNRTGNQPAPHINNGVLNRHQPPPPLAICYGKCLKNYAATNGGQILDGCGEFMLSPNTTSLECAACGCHRSFHRIEADHLHQTMPQVIECQCNHQHQHHQQHHHHPPTPPSSRLAAITKSSSTPDSQSPSPISSSYYPAPPHMFLTLNPGLPPPEPANINRPSILTHAVASGSNPKGKKRFRTKFSEYQKEKMQEFAERIGWKMLKTEEEMIVGFCKHIGITKSVFKVWMHNHKTINGNPGNRRNNDQNHRDHIGTAIGANGSSSSS
ncbi:zinc-finger homeodomain protein 8 [Lactuca sativa]|uniref:zinc-finger homeodomain protein 8 n=1 Tax=Lactuca sativa TaxID=4236 RepID=UPI000CB66839|nr:zinc-finger homeodomain protein 8 [Lactuca sativa]